MNIMPVAGATVAAGVTVGGAALVVLHVLPTGLSPVRDPVSQYGITRFRAGYRTQTLAYAAAGIAAAAGLAAAPGRHTPAVVLCAMFAVCRAVIGWVPMDAPGAPSTTTGRAHGMLATGAFLGVALAAGALARSVSHTGAHAGAATAGGILSVLMVVTLVTLAVSRRAGVRRFGLIERVFYAEMTAWLVLVAIVLLGG